MTTATKTERIALQGGEVVKVEKYDHAGLAMRAITGTDESNYPSLLEVTEDASGWRRYHWAIYLSYDGRAIVSYYSMGVASTRPPSVVEVLHSMFYDYRYVEESSDMYDFFDNLGLTPSRESEATYEACKRTGENLKHLFGDDYDEWAEAFSEMEL